MKTDSVSGTGIGHLKLDWYKGANWVLFDPNELPRFAQYKQAQGECMNNQDSASIVITFLLLLPWLGRAAVSTMMRFLCAERRVRTPARSIDAALLVELYIRNYDYLLIKSVSLTDYFSVREVSRWWQFFVSRCEGSSDIQVRCRM